MYTSTIISLLSLLALTSAVPTPVDLAPRCGTTLFPSFIQQIKQDSPDAVGANTLSSGGDFGVSKNVNGNGQATDEVRVVVGFENIPAGSYGCQLAATFPANYAISKTGNPTLNVDTLFVHSPASIAFPNNWSWNVVAPAVTSLFGTVNLLPGATQVINSETCQSNLAFVFSIADWIGVSSSIDFAEYVNKANGAGLAGIYLTYDC